MPARNDPQDEPAPRDAAPPPPTDEKAARAVIRNMPWVGISIAAHVIVISVLSVMYVRREKPDEVVHITAVYTAAPEPPDVIEPPPEVIDRDAIPDVPEEIPEQEIPDDVPIVTVDDFDAGREDLTEPTLDPDAVDAGTGYGFTGGTSIGVGAGGHHGTGVSTRAGRLGPGGGLGKGKYGARGAKGGGHATQKVVAEGLDWLARHQDPRGFWSAYGFVDQCRTNTCTGRGDEVHTIGVTGLSLLAFLGAGQTLDSGKHRAVVARGVKYLLQMQDPETGAFGEVDSSQGFMYDQALASLAMCEAYGLSGNVALKKAAQKAVHFVQEARNPYKAWRYSYPPNGENDTSVTGWMVMVLRSAKDFGLEVDDAAFDGAKLFLDEMTDPQTGRCGYIDRGSWSAREPGIETDWPADKVEAMTAVALVCRIFMGAEPSAPELRAGADLLRKSLPQWDPQAGTIDYYYWYYGSYAMFQMGGADWKVWEAKMLKAVVDSQAKEGCENGSWNPAFDPWGHRGGRVYSTAIMTLCAEVYYRYTRVIGARHT